MGYTIRRWMSVSGWMSVPGMLFDDTRKVKTAEEAVKAAENLAGICRSLISDDVKNHIRELEPGERYWLKKKSLGFTMTVRRTK